MCDVLVARDSLLGVFEARRAKAFAKAGPAFAKDAPPHPSLTRRELLTGQLGASLAGGCRSGAARGPLVLRLSHSMATGTTALHVFADKFRELVENATVGAVRVRVFPSGTLGQEREVVQQLQEGLVDFMVSGTAIGKRRAEAASVRLPLPVARLVARTQARRRSNRHRSGRLSGADGPRGSRTGAALALPSRDRSRGRVREPAQARASEPP